MTKKIPKRIKELCALLLFIYIIVGGIFQYVNTREAGYIILPGIFALVILWELTARFFGADQKNEKEND